MNESPGNPRKLTAFPPLVEAGSRLLILGSMPSAESLRRQEYYAHPQNTFWRIIHNLWGEASPAEYALRVRFLLDRRLALWDVLADCRREGSADSAIRDGTPNDFAAFFRMWPQITRICFNGQTAAKLFGRLVLKKNGLKSPEGLNPGLTAFQLGSTSPARAVPYAERLQEWQRIRELIEKGSDKPESRRNG
jgi:TDG/mug DNA glycosylase family protein